jgi:hypothetical protein
LSSAITARSRSIIEACSGRKSGAGTWKAALLDRRQPRGNALLDLLDAPGDGREVRIAQRADARGERRKPVRGAVVIVAARGFEAVAEFGDLALHPAQRDELGLQPAEQLLDRIEALGLA